MRPPARREEIGRDDTRRTRFPPRRTRTATHPLRHRAAAELHADGLLGLRRHAPAVGGRRRLQQARALRVERDRRDPRAGARELRDPDHAMGNVRRGRAVRLRGGGRRAAAFGAAGGPRDARLHPPRGGRRRNGRRDLHRRVHADARRRARRLSHLRELVPLLGFHRALSGRRSRPADRRPAVRDRPAPHHLFGRPRVDRRRRRDPAAPFRSRDRAEGAAHPAGRRDAERERPAAASAGPRAGDAPEGQARDSPDGTACRAGAVARRAREQARPVDAAARAAVQGRNGQEPAGVRETGAAAHGRVAADQFRPHGGGYRVELRVRRCVAPRARVPQAVRRAAGDLSGAWRGSGGSRRDGRCDGRLRRGHRRLTADAPALLFPARLTHRKAIVDRTDFPSNGTGFN
ncbi:hypothetical protein BCEP4_1640045 [Burkholderia cepacia]|nr:hypothetical protein BCEP4_1640045 [Burkholderia cepacia]